MLNDDSTPIEIVITVHTNMMGHPMETAKSVMLEFTKRVEQFVALIATKLQNKNV